MEIEDHFQKRLFQRFKIKLTLKELNRLKDDIEDGKYPMISVIMRGASLNYLVDIKGKKVIVVYNHYRKYLLSALKPSPHYKPKPQKYRL